MHPLFSFLRFHLVRPAFVACLLMPASILASDDPHAAAGKITVPPVAAPAPVTKPATASPGAAAPGGATAAAAVPASTTPSSARPAAPAGVHGAAPAASPVQATPGSTAAAEARPKLIGKDGKPIPTATPQEVATRIAEKLALLRAEKGERGTQEVRGRVGAPAPARRAMLLARAETEPRAVGVSPIEAKVAAKAAHRDIHWSYGGEEGPIRWAEMNPEWAKCGNGQRQSPIDIRSGIKVELEPITFDYKASGFSVIDNGHTIQVNLGAGNHITVSGRMYELVQFHFHRPSEEKINGRGFDMVAHLVHRDSAGKLAVVAVLIERGAARALVQTVWNNLPLEKNETVTPVGTIDMNGILPARRDYYTYMGSLTTPPCSEGVLWMVMKEPVSVSQDQIDIFARLYQMNARPIQLTSERLIKESN